MSKKVKLTREQALVVEDLKKNHKGLKDLFYKDTCMDWAHPHFHKMSDETLAIALYTDVGYEVEPEFEKGQWIYDVTDENKTVIEVAYVTDARVHGFWKTKHSDFDTHVVIENARHFTKEEIAEEKQRRWWEEHEREPWGIREGDILSDSSDFLIVDWFDSDDVGFKVGKTNAEYLQSFDIVKSDFKVVCFAEDRKDV